MKPMAILAVLIGALEAMGAGVEGWVGGVNGGDGYSLAWGAMVVTAGVLLVVSGVALLRRAPSASAWAHGAAIACLAAFASRVVIEGRLSMFATILGIAFPIALLVFLHAGRGRSTPMAAR